MYKVEYITWETPEDQVKEICDRLGLDSYWVKKTQANYRTTLVIHGDSFLAVSYTDEMEPEDCVFTRDLSWVKNELERAYQQGLKDGKEKP